MDCTVYFVYTYSNRTSVSVVPEELPGVTDRPRVQERLREDVGQKGLYGRSIWRHEHMCLRTPSWSTLAHSICWTCPIVLKKLKEVVFSKKESTLVQLVAMFCRMRRWSHQRTTTKTTVKPVNWTENWTEEQRSPWCHVAVQIHSNLLYLCVQISFKK